MSGAASAVWFECPQCEGIYPILPATGECVTCRVELAREARP